jgi:hypothetical protein
MAARTTPGNFRLRKTEHVLAARKIPGNFRLRKTEHVMEMVPRDFDNPWNFFSLMALTDEQVHEWLRMQGLLATTVHCTSPDCSGQMYLRSSANSPGDSIVNRLHTKNCRIH